MKITLNRGTVVRMKLQDGRVFFGALTGNVEVLPQNGVYLLASEKCYHGWLEPLTSKVREGICRVSADSIAAIEVCPNLPIMEEYVVETAETLAADVQLLGGSTENLDQFSQAFVRRMIQFLTGQESPLLREVDESNLCIRSKDLSVLGLDFLRQHYDSIKETAITTGQIPDPGELARLLASTENHRTTDADWSGNVHLW